MPVNSNTIRSRVNLHKRGTRDVDGLYKLTSIRITKLKGARADSREVRAARDLIEMVIRRSDLSALLKEQDETARSFLRESAKREDIPIAQFPPYSEQWWAAKIRDQIDVVRRLIKDHSHLTTVAQEGIQLGRLIELCHSRAFEADAVRGRIVRRASSDGGFAKAKVKQSDSTLYPWQERANSLWKKNPRLSKSDVARDIVKDFPGASFNTVRQKIVCPDITEIS